MACMGATTLASRKGPRPLTATPAVISAKARRTHAAQSAEPHLDPHCPRKPKAVSRAACQGGRQVRERPEYDSMRKNKVASCGVALLSAWLRRAVTRC